MLRILLLFMCLLCLNAAAGSAGRYGMGYVPVSSSTYASFQTAPRFRAFLPESVDLSDRFPKPGYQGQQGSCSAWATAYALRSYHQAKKRNWKPVGDTQVFSPSYVFNQLSSSGQCNGASIPATLDLMKSQGVASLANFPYREDNCLSQPSSDTKNIASSFRIKSWSAIGSKSSLDDVKGQLANGNPVVFGMNISDSFKELHGDRVYDDTSSPRIGGHAMVLVGYSDHREAFKVINSWGTDWGAGGFGWISYRAAQALNNWHEYYVIDETFDPVPLPDPLPLVTRLKPEPPTPAVITPPPEPPTPVVVPPPPKPPTPIIITPTPQPPVIVIPPRRVEPTLEEIHKAVTSLVKQIPCSRIDASLGVDLSVGLAGFIGSDAELEKLQGELSSLNGVKQVSSNVSVRPWPQCEVLLNFAAPLSVEKGLKVRLGGASRDEFKSGDSLTIEVDTPSFPSYLYVSYLQASGEVVNLSWPTRRSPKLVPANAKLRFGGGSNGQPVFRVGPPFGDEIVIVVASRTLLFDADLPDTSNDRDYLTSFRRAIKVRRGAGHDKGVVTAAVATIHTQQ
ncbi:MAG: DUF4384 domain-containing protein [Proteobacteria bacterium]|nr:DUF4384 domain-containing protein [Pseudomonadota bacterium]